MKRVRVKLRTKISALNISVVVISLVITIVLIYQMRMSWITKEAEINLMNISKIISKSPFIIDGLKNKKDSDEMQSYVKDIVKSGKDVDSISIVDLNGNTYANSDFEKMYDTSVQGISELASIQNKEILEDKVESFGKLIISFVVIRDDKKDPIGFIMAKVLTNNIEIAKYEIVITLILVILSGLLIGSVGSLIISKSVKESLLGYEAEQISKLFIQKQEVLDSLDDGIIAVDENFKVTFYNKGALNILKIDEDIIGEKIINIISNSNLYQVFKDGEPQYNKEMIINNTIVVTNRIPIKSKEKVIGAVAIFRDKTEVTRLAEEVTGVRQVVEALRANNHEFMNKLHVILGLIQIGETDEAKKYIIKQTKEQQQKVSLVMNKIEDSTIAALILGKISRAKEMGVELYIDSNSNLKKRKGRINSHALVTIIGNLLENAIEAVSISDKEKKEVNILIKEDSFCILIDVKDTGTGISKENLSNVFNNGFSTKGENRGKGLVLLNQIVENLNGKVEVFSNVNEGCRFKVCITKEEKDD
ncbi:ATP-binding protein [Clostridium peptidivorans]|uniref:ATP-binding protein n=1 Tax=Clostridium peptidivorans TaxID=100174 RepID=UPI000BE24933|nr:ATP-binding protein [Clostridium peptidivorans]